MYEKVDVINIKMYKDGENKKGKSYVWIYIANCNHIQKDLSKRREASFVALILVDFSVSDNGHKLTSKFFKGVSKSVPSFQFEMN